MPYQTVPFDSSHLTAAAELVCMRYRKLRQDVPHLPEVYEQVDAFLPKLQNLLKESPAGSCFAHLSNGKLGGFLLGVEIPDFMGRRAIYSPEWANAALLDVSFPIYESLYTAWSAYWVAHGCQTHLVSLLASDWDGVDALQWLGFGMAVVDGVRHLSPLPAIPPNDVLVRQVLPDAQGAFSPADCALAAQFDQALLAHVAAAPCFWPHDADEAPTFSGAGWLTTPGNALWIASQGDIALGYLGVTPSSQDACTIIRDPGTLSIVKAYTLPEARRRGVGTDLLNCAIAWADEQGYRRCSVDYEAANPPARRFWERWFEPVVISLVRVVRNGGV